MVVDAGTKRIWEDTLFGWLESGRKRRDEIAEKTDWPPDFVGSGKPRKWNPEVIDTETGESSIGVHLKNTPDAWVLGYRAAFVVDEVSREARIMLLEMLRMFYLRGWEDATEKIEARIGPLADILDYPTPPS